MKQFFALIVLSLTLFVSSAFASWSEDFAELKDLPRSYEDYGAICEEVARLDMKKQYPAPQYTVEVGIAYADSDRTIGELDVIVMDNNIQKAILIAEVKCWKDVRGGLKKAHAQRSRFLNNLRSNKKLFFQFTSNNKPVDAAVFDHVKDFISIAQKGSISAGFDQELQYTLDEMHEHRADMIRCQSKGECAKPKK